MVKISDELLQTEDATPQRGLKTWKAIPVLGWRTLPYSHKIRDLALSDIHLLRHSLNEADDKVKEFLMPDNLFQMVIESAFLIQKCLPSWLRQKNTLTTSLQRGKCYPPKNYLMMSIQSWRSGKCGVPFHNHFCQVHSDSEWL